jgi:hypothetical protein
MAALETLFERIMVMPSIVVVDKFSKFVALEEEFDGWVRQLKGAKPDKESYNIMRQKMANFADLCTPTVGWRYPVLDKDLLEGEYDPWEKVKRREEEIPFFAYMLRLESKTSVLDPDEKAHRLVAVSKDRAVPVVNGTTWQCMTCGYLANLMDVDNCTICGLGSADYYMCSCNKLRVAGVENKCRFCDGSSGTSRIVRPRKAAYSEVDLSQLSGFQRETYEANKDKVPEDCVRLGHPVIWDAPCKCASNFFCLICLSNLFV